MPNLRFIPNTIINPDLSNKSHINAEHSIWIDNKHVSVNQIYI